MTTTRKALAKKSFAGLTKMLAPTNRRVRINTDAATNEQIRRQTERNVEFFAQHPELIPERLQELDREWDIERVLEMSSTAFSLLGLFMSVRRRRAWLIVPWVVQSFFMQHIIQGWCPPLSFFRKRGIRTQSEISQERYALKALRGDFRFGKKQAEGAGNAQAAFQAAGK